MKEVEIPTINHADIAGAVTFLAEGFTVSRELLRTSSHSLGLIFRTYIYAGGLFTATDYIQAQRARSRLKREVSRVFDEVDVIVTPSTMSPPEKLEKFHPLILLDPSYLTTSVLFNIVGSPVISVPCDFSQDGLPIGLQIAGRPFDEPTVLKVAYAYQQQKPLYKKHPPI